MEQRLKNCDSAIHETQTSECYFFLQLETDESFNFRSNLLFGSLFLCGEVVLWETNNIK